MRHARRTLVALTAAGAGVMGLAACAAGPEQTPEPAAAAEAEAGPEQEASGQETPTQERPGHPGAGDHAYHTAPGGDAGSGDDAVAAELAAANLAAAAFQDVELAEEAGWGSTMEDLGCFESADAGGMGLHYVNPDLMDDTVAVDEPEGLVYELDHEGQIVDLVAHEYIVPVEAWTAEEPPRLFGRDFHQHSVLPLWVLHAWIWKDNPAGVFQDYNPTVRPCPDGVPIFGEDLP